VRLPVPPRPHVGDNDSLTASEKACKPSQATLTDQYPIMALVRHKVRNNASFAMLGESVLRHVSLERGQRAVGI